MPRAQVVYNGTRQRKPSTSSTAQPEYPPSATASTSTLSSIRATASHLLHWDDLPSWRRDNAFILSGYRPHHPSYLTSFTSLFYLHNESVNIWSHLLGCLCALGLSLYLYHIVHPRHATATDADVVVFACFFAGAVLCLGMSATFHATMCHSEQVMRWGNKLDYTGIVALIVGSFVPALYYGLYCKVEVMRVYLFLICVLGVGCGIVSWVDKFRTPEWRPYRAAMFVSLGLSAVVPVAHGILMYGYQGLEERMSISLVIAQGLMYIFGAFLYAVRWPERTAPGNFDLWGSSHQIFHVFVVLAAMTHLYAMARAFDYHHTVMGSRCVLD